MENLQVTEKEISWERRKKRHFKNIVYRSKVYFYDNDLTIVTDVFIEGNHFREEVNHIPKELLESIMKLK